ncbi:MAG: yijE 1 [Verrucomicrobiaceae bacterium]|nr:yijE 1 [Verrucomicrobiaceae bacterium]
MTRSRIIIFTCLAMLAFASNSLLCRLALKHTAIDAASFTAIRLVSGAATLFILARLRNNNALGRGNWWSALSLFIYAAGFSFAYVNLPAATGALLLFGSVQATMIGHGLYVGERFSRLQIIGLALACCGLISLLLPGLSAPPLRGSLLMLSAGLAWGIYSLRGKKSGDPIQVNAGNFLRAVPIAIVLSLLTLSTASFDMAGIGFAIVSGAIASGIGYAVWYAALPALKATHAAIVQLSVPIIAAGGGVIFLSEPMTMRLVLASVAVLGGIALIITAKTSATKGAH